MSAGRRNARREAVFILYRQDLLGLSPGDALGRISDEDAEPYTRTLVLGVDAQLEAIDAAIERHLAGWRLARLGTLERSILRVSTFELLHDAVVPRAVAINEAVELAKRYCSDEAGALVNGILGSIAESEGERALQTGKGRDNGLEVTT